MVMTQKSNRLQAWFVVFAAASFFFFQFINMNSFDALSPYLMRSFHADAVQISTLSAMYFYGNLFMIPMGLLLDRFSTKKMLLIGATVAVICTYMFGHTHSLTEAFILRFIIGICSTLCLLTTVKLTSRWFPCNKGGYVIGWVLTFAMLGGIVAQQLEPIIPHLSSWREAVDGIAGIGIIVIILIAFIVKDYPESYARQHIENVKNLKAGFWKNFAGSLSNIQNWIGPIYANVLSIPVVVIGALFAESYLTHVRQLTPLHAAFVSSMIFFGVLIGSPVAGFISDKMRRRKLPMILGGALTLGVSLLIVYMPNLSTPTLVSLFFLLGFCSGSQVITFALVVEVNPPHRTASSESLSALIIMSAGMIFQPVFAWILQSNWHGAMQDGVRVYSELAYHHAMEVLPAALLIGFILSFFVKETRCKQLTVKE